MILKKEKPCYVALAILYGEFLMYQVVAFSELQLEVVALLVSFFNVCCSFISLHWFTVRLSEVKRNMSIKVFIGKICQESLEIISVAQLNMDNRNLLRPMFSISSPCEILHSLRNSI